MEEQEKSPFSLNDHAAQLFEKVLYVTKNSRRRSILEAFNNHKIMTTHDVQQQLKEKGLLKNTKGYTKGKIRENHLILLIETGMLKEIKDNTFEITAFGKDIKEIISKVKEFDALPIPTHRKLYPERVCLALRSGKKTYSELRSKLGLPRAYGLTKRLREAGFIKINHPHGLASAPALSRFTASPYHSFVQCVESFVEKNKRSWFTEYAVISYLTVRWQKEFGRPIDLEETRKLLEKAVKIGDLKKTKGGYYSVSIAKVKLQTSAIKSSIERLESSGKTIFDLIKQGYDHVPMMVEKSGLPPMSIYKIIERLKNNNLIEEHKEKELVTIELTEKGKKLADCLFKIKECVRHYIYIHKIHLEKRVEIESKNETNRKNFLDTH